MCVCVCVCGESCFNYTYVIGRGFFRTCPMNANGAEDCGVLTELQGEVGRSVEFDARVEYRHGGSCGAKQNVRFMSLKKVEESGAERRIFICSN